MFDLNLSSEQIEFREMVRSFATNEIRPAALKPDRLEPFAKPLLVDLLNEASALGLRTLTISEDNGGVGSDTVSSCIVLEELATGDVDIATVMGRTALLGQELFDQHMTDAQRERFLEAFHKDETYHLAYTGTDSNSGLGWSYHGDVVSDAAALPTAKADGDDFVINGTIEHVANAPVAGLLVVEVKSENGTSALLVPRDTAELTISDALDVTKGDFIRWHHGAAAKVEFKSCRVSKDNLLGTEGQNPLNASGYHVRDTLQRAAINLGLGQVAFETAIEYAGIRRQGAKNIIEHDNIGDKIADMAIKLELARTMIWKAAWAAENPDAIGQGSVSDLPLEIVAATFTAESVQDITVLAAECFGAMGVMRDMPLQKFVNDSNIFANSGDHDIATKLRIAEAVVGYMRAKAA